MIASVRPRDLAGKTRRRLAAELEAIDKRIRALDKELAELVTARGSTLMDLQGMAAVQLRNQTKGRACHHERRAGGMPSMMAMRPQTAPFQRGLRPHARRPETTRSGPGRATGDDN